MVSEKVTRFSKEEIQKKIEALTEPGSTVFFYLAGSPAMGGPLGRGAAIVELNPDYPAKSKKKYVLYCADVEGTQPTSHRMKMSDESKSSIVADWIAERHLRVFPKDIT